MQEKITFVMVVKNVEDKSLDIFEKVVLQAAKLSSHFIFVDNGSTDGTVSHINRIAKKAKLNWQFFTDKRKEFDYLKYEYSKKVKTDYICVLDDDEVFSEKSIGEVKDILVKKPALVRVRWDTYLGEMYLQRTSKPCLFARKNNILCNTKKLHVQYDKEKIGKLNPKKVVRTKHPLLHYSWPNVDYLLAKSKRYAKYEAEELFSRKPNLNPFTVFCKFVFEGMLYFLYYFFLLPGFASMPKFLYAHNAFFYRYMKFFYYVELQQKKK